MELLTVRDLAAIVKAHPGSIYRAAARKEIPSIYVPGVGLRFIREDIEDFLQSLKKEKKVKGK